MPLVLNDALPPPPRNTIPSKSAMLANEERRKLHHEAEVVIVGAGVVGCALAIALGKQGRSVILLERSLKEPDRIVGELLQPGGMKALEKLGLVDTVMDIDAIPTYGYEVINHGEAVKIPYPMDQGGKQEAGTAFHHGRFIRRLRERALKTENVTVIETTVTSMVSYRDETWGKRSDQVLGVETMSKETGRGAYFGQLTVVCDGYASKWRKDFLPHAPQVRSKFYALELIDADLPAPNHGHVIITDGAPVLLYQIGTHETRALVDVPEGLPSMSASAGGIKNHLQNHVLPSLPPQVQPSFAAAITKGQFRSMPNSFLPPATNRTPGLLIIGDALNMRHPLTGGGMTVGLNDVVLIRDLLSPEKVHDLGNTDAVLEQLRAFHWERKNLGSVINILAMALYSLFAANNPHLRALQAGCFRYFQLGPSYIHGPVSLLSGLCPRPLVLFYHFFSVALLAIWMLILESPIYMLPVTLWKGIMTFWTACVVIGPYMIVEMRS